MSLSSLLRHSVEVLEPTGASVDAYGNVASAYPATGVTVRAFVQAAAKTESDIGNADTVIGDYDVYFAPTTAVTESARLRWDGKVLQVIGVRAEQRPGKTHHLRVLAKGIE